MKAKVFAVFIALALTACHAAPAEHTHPALWQVTGAAGETGYIFGTVHALPDGLGWKTPAIDRAIADSGMLVLEIVDPSDESAARAAFQRLGTTPGQPPLEQRVDPALREALKGAMAKTRLQPAQFASLEDWAAALTLSFALEAKDGYDPGNGADRALVAAAGRRPVVGLETLEGQLGLFDALPAREQRALLNAIVAEGAGDVSDKRLVKAWAEGDVATLDREAHAGMMADPRLREALLVGRNRDWAEQIAAMLRQGKRPFVAVGAAHVAGIDGLPQMLAARGYEIKRVQ
ncbi:TraB/GumN family protein [Novosphingobium sp. Gsoil 351]|uniref:TraB/GumN family protein n=1 Tax=Novosphingobium sp. Gsoil 351 TaxID=2675225 RepID=UPI0012B48949|nr:TraB/GumN family protein [Novosphingobium sp. Gsoil 351]QGN53548.1 TraB/GumN family protein [Novosphingobium sp. Gsoil 351]